MILFLKIFNIYRLFFLESVVVMQERDFVDGGNNFFYDGVLILFWDIYKVFCDGILFVAFKQYL